LFSVIDNQKFSVHLNGTFTKTYGELCSSSAIVTLNQGDSNKGIQHTWQNKKDGTYKSGYKV
jgi:hypothetical protein